MSRSYRKPYSAICGGGSASWDKFFAHRGERNAHKLAIKMCLDWDEFLIPHKYECSHNEVYGWARDGNQSYQMMGRIALTDYGLGDTWLFDHMTEWLKKVRRK